MEITLQEDLQPPERDVSLLATEWQVYLGLAAEWQAKRHGPKAENRRTWSAGCETGVKPGVHRRDLEVSKARAASLLKWQT
jgi:hypothetical protein